MPARTDREHLWVEINFAGPLNGATGLVDVHPGKNPWIANRQENALGPGKILTEVNLLHRSVRKSDADDVALKWLNTYGTNDLGHFSGSIS
ncbi:MAG: hypothetical protein WB507_02745 [Solirubrobacterales bacterium]